MKRLLLIPLVLFLACEDKEEEPFPLDCAGVEGGTAKIDSCQVCDSDTTNDCIKDCSGDWGGNAVIDDCGVCDGNNSTCQLNFSLVDLNPYSETYGVNIGPQFFYGKVTLYYFPFSET